MLRATPIVAITLGAIGLSALAAKADYVLIPVLIASAGLVLFGVYRRNRSGDADCCATDANTRKLSL